MDTAKQYAPLLIGGAVGLVIVASMLSAQTGQPLLPGIGLPTISGRDIVLGCVGIIGIAFLSLVIVAGHYWRGEQAREAAPARAPKRATVHRATPQPQGDMVPRAEYDAAAAQRDREAARAATAERDRDIYARAFEKMKKRTEEAGAAEDEARRKLAEAREELAIARQQPAATITHADMLAFAAWMRDANNWTRDSDKPSVRAMRDRLRGMGVPIPEAEYKVFSASVSDLLPLPRTELPAAADSPTTDGGGGPRTDGRTRATGRSQPRRGKR